MQIGLPVGAVGGAAALEGPSRLDMSALLVKECLSLHGRTHESLQMNQSVGRMTYYVITIV